MYRERLTFDESVTRNLVAPTDRFAEMPHQRSWQSLRDGVEDRCESHLQKESFSARHVSVPSKDSDVHRCMQHVEQGGYLNYFVSCHLTAELVPSTTLCSGWRRCRRQSMTSCTVGVAATEAVM